MSAARKGNLLLQIYNYILIFQSRLTKSILHEEEMKTAAVNSNICLQFDLVNFFSTWIRLTRDASDIGNIHALNANVS